MLHFRQESASSLREQKGQVQICLSVLSVSSLSSTIADIRVEVVVLLLLAEEVAGNQSLNDLDRRVEVTVALRDLELAGSQLRHDFPPPR